jgi:hypothetical protein
MVSFLIYSQDFLECLILIYSIEKRYDKATGTFVRRGGIRKVTVSNKEEVEPINVAANKIFQSPPKTIKVLSASAIPSDEEELLEEVDSEDSDCENKTCT